MQTGYRRLAIGYLITASLPWWVIGVGVLSGQVRIGPELLLSWRANPFVLGALGTLAGMWVVGAWWVFLRGGAEFLAQHPGAPFTPPMPGNDRGDPQLIKLLCCVGALANVLAVAMLWFVFTPPAVPAAVRGPIGTNGYILAYDASRVWVRDGFDFIPLVLLAAGIGVLTWDRKHPNPRRTPWQAAFPYVYTGFAVFGVILSVGGNLSAHSEAVKALRSGRYEIVEGTVTNFVPMPWEGHANESFDVAGHHYEYSDFVVTTGFRQSRSHGGPIREGLRVRIADVGGRIFRLEIAP